MSWCCSYVTLVLWCSSTNCVPLTPLREQSVLCRLPWVPPILPLLAYLTHKGTPHPTLSQTLWATPHISNSDTASIYMGPFREHVKLSWRPLISQSMTFHHSGLISKYAIRCQDHVNSTKSGDKPSLPFHPCVNLRIHSLHCFLYLSQ